MNSIKNTIVTVTLLAVSYGAYVVLSEPPSESALSSGDNWNQNSPDIDDGAPMVQMPDETTLTSTQQDPGLVQMPPQGTADISQPPVDSTAWPTEYTADAQPPVDATANPADLNPPTYDQPPAHEYPTASLPALPDTHNGQPNNGQPNNGQPNNGQPNNGLSQNGQQPVQTAQPADAFEEAWKSIQSNIASGQMDDALFALTVWYGEKTLSDEQTQRCVNLLDQLAGTVIYSQDSFMEPAYVVQEGETIEEIATKYSVPTEFLARINGVEPPYQLYPGETLKVVRGPFRAEVSGETGEITVFLGRYYAGRFAARIGGDLPDEVTNFEVAVKEPGREYFDRRTGFRVGREDPTNPYGNRWIGLRGQQITAAHNVGIHVDNGHPDGGCIAVSPQDADDLTAILSVGSRVVVRR